MAVTPARTPVPAVTRIPVTPARQPVAAATRIPINGPALQALEAAAPGNPQQFRPVLIEQVGSC